MVQPRRQSTGQQSPHNAERDDHRKVQPTSFRAAEQDDALDRQQAPTYPDSLLSDSRLEQRGNTPVRNALVHQAQQSYGNRAVQRCLSGARSGESLATRQRGLQRKTEVARESTPEHRQNDTGMPDNLKSGVETLAGMPLDDVRVHYESPEPARFQALAYTQGSDVYMGPGQEQHVAHEAWHVVQQKQGRVAATTQMKGLDVNEDDQLEREADVMGARALSLPAEQRTPPPAASVSAQPTPVLQAKVIQLLNSAQKKALDKIKEAVTAETDAVKRYTQIKAALDTLSAGTPQNIADAAKYLKVTVQKPAAPAAARPATPPATTLVYDPHGDKHFTGQDSQWLKSKEDALELMEGDITPIIDTLWQHDNPNDKGVTLFYYTLAAKKDIGEQKGTKAPTNVYTIQIDCKFAAGEIGYHGYPDKPTEKLGLGYTKHNKPW